MTPSPHSGFSGAAKRLFFDLTNLCEGMQMAISLLPDNPGAWTYRHQDLYAIPREEREKLQLEAVRINFTRMHILANGAANT